MANGGITKPMVRVNLLIQLVALMKASGSMTYNTDLVRRLGKKARSNLLETMCAEERKVEEDTTGLMALITRVNS
jgi:hypothetical protein